ncbi:MAG TPA: MauE/DoxX family redox-associated membrane protein [Opitutaceae bacterium]|nr:MauE/DoxX family redox-associated membrane protein [Opitutaceae bacterium]
MSRHAERWIRIGLVVLYAITGILKLKDPAAFAFTLENYRLLPATGSAALALFVPWMEIACALTLLSSSWRGTGWWIAALLGFGFSVFVLSAWIRGLDIHCGCWGDSAYQPIGVIAAIRAVGLLILALFGLRHQLRAARAPSPKASETQVR